MEDLYVLYTLLILAWWNMRYDNKVSVAVFFVVLIITAICQTAVIIYQ